MNFVRGGDEGDALALRAIADIVATREEESDELIGTGNEEAGARR